MKEPNDGTVLELFNELYSWNLMITVVGAFGILDA